MAHAIRIALVGDFNHEVLAHRAIEQCFFLANGSSLAALQAVWLPTEKIVPGDPSAFGGFDGMWGVPASPYRNTEGALWAIQYSRTQRLPFLGTCGGMQHALLEYARNVLGLLEAGHTEDEPNTKLPLLSRMACPLVEKEQQIVVTPGSSFRNIYGSDAGQEGFHCSYGLNPEFERLFSNGPLEIAARSAQGEVRAIALRGHPFFIGTLFQPERRALTGSLHAVVRAFFAACAFATA
jgi:CTP synthase (UTP-ammonia lyase)